MLEDVQVSHGSCEKCLWRAGDVPSEAVCTREDALGPSQPVSTWFIQHFYDPERWFGCPGWMGRGLTPRIDPDRFEQMKDLGKTGFCRYELKVNRKQITFVLRADGEVQIVGERQPHGQPEWVEHMRVVNSVDEALRRFRELRLHHWSLEESELATSPLAVRGEARTLQLRELAGETCFYPADREELYIKAGKEGWTDIPDAPDITDIFRGCRSAVLQQALRGEVYCVVVDQQDQCTVGLLWAAGRRSPQRQQPTPK